MKIVLDTSIICADYHFRGTHFRAFLDGLSTVPGELLVPAVVIDEAANRFKEDLEAQLHNYRKNRSTLSRMLAKPEEGPSFEVDVSIETARYRDMLLGIIMKHGRMLPYPEVSHKELVARDLLRRKPFKESGAGYRDALIWHSVKSLLLWGTERVVLVTDNSKDFGEGPGVHADLLQELVRPEQLTLMRSMRSFNETHVMPQMKLREEVKRALGEKEPPLDLMKWLHSNLAEALDGWQDELGSAIFGFPTRESYVRLIDVVQFHNLSIKEVREMASGENLIRLYVRSDLEFDVQVDWETYRRSEVVRDFLGNMEHFKSASVHAVHSCDIDIALTVSAGIEMVTSHEVLSIEGSEHAERAPFHDGLVK